MDKAHLRVIPPVPADYDALAMYHSRVYLDFILDHSNSSSNVHDGKDERYAEYGIEEVRLSFVCIHPAS